VDPPGESPVDPAPPPDEQPSAPPAPSDGQATESGVWTRCGDTFCLDGQTLELGADEMATQVLADYDGDGNVEQNSAEFDGLIGTLVTVTVAKESAGWIVLVINGHPYRPAAG
jgi:hypothetical protein